MPSSILVLRRKWAAEAMRSKHHARVSAVVCGLSRQTAVSSAKARSRRVGGGWGMGSVARMKMVEDDGQPWGTPVW